ncbi:MAG TPA: hypothetical protein DIW31_01045, partial [Bacteroidales bacterium]|nr:hypothetical protein [Bacteroidales bacterium]
MKIKSLEHIKFLLVTLLVLASCANSIGQIIEITTDIPEFSPPSPNAYQIGRFGQVPVNESTGAINYSIPLHTYKVGDITVPVTLNYSGNGVKVDQSSSLTGINWTLMAGGVIIREVRDREDKIASNRYFFEIDELNALPNAWNLDQGVWANTINEMVNDVTADSEVDIYSFNFSSYSGSFFFDQDMNPHLVNYNTELKISRIYDNDNHLVIKITTPDGFNYFFGGTKGSEYTTTRKFHVDPGTETNLQTALYLYKIISPKGSIVEFDYFHLIYEIETGQSFISINDLGKDCQFSNIDNTNTTGDRYLTYFNNGQAILRKIYSNLSNDSIVFYNSALQIDSIAYFNNNGKKYKSNQLIYQYPHDENGVINSRFFLTNVKEKDSANCFTGNNYKMSYDRLNLLPKQFALAQDYFGYYNGIYSTTLIPKGISSFLDSREGSGYADREPDFNFAKIGSLSSIEYPTGGISEFEYESGQGGYKYTNDPITLNTYSYNSSNESLYSVYTNEGLYFSPIVTDSIIIELSSYASERVLRAQFAELIVTNLTDNIQFFYSIGIGSLHEPGSYSNNNNFFKCKTLKNKLYKFELIMDSGDSNQQGTYTSATAKIKYFIPKDALGLRIKRITEKAEPNTNLGYIKRFYYNKKENINDTVIQEYNTQFYLFLEDNITYCEFEEIPFWAHIYRTSLYSSSILDVYVDDSHKNLYPNVTISYGGDNFENGGEELEFKVTKEPFAEIYKEPFGEKSVGSRIFTSSRGNKAWDNGTLLRKRVFKKENGIFKILKDEKYCYKIDASKSFSITNYVGKKTKFQGLVNPSGVHNISLNSYNCYSTWNSLDSIVKIDYFGTDSIVTYQKIYYDIGIPGLPTRVVTKDSKSNQLTSKTYYPDNANLINGITSQELSTIDSMRRNNLHMINSPIQTEQLRNECILNATRVIYKNWGQNFSQTGPLILPDTIKVSGEITNPYLLEARVKYYRYDTLGNPLEFSKVDDSHTVLLWGYNSLNPIAKIQNATYDEVQAILGQEIISQLASSFDNVFIENQIAITRTALPDAMITTFIYNPSVGLIKQIDPNGIISKYEYDSFGRLKFIKDHDGNVLKSYDYHYSGQTPTDNFFTYTVTFDLQGEDSLPKLTTPAGIIISPDDPTRTGYTFEGWYKEAACTNAWNFATDLVTTNVTLYARWTANTYAITYTLNGGTNSPSNTATYTYGVGLTLSDPSRTGYTFGGWYLEPTFVNAISTISATATGDRTLYARWTA